MSSSSEEADIDDVNKIDKVDRSVFVRLVSDHTVLLSKSKTPAVLNAKKEAWETVRSAYCGAMGHQVTIGQLIKALNNLKSTVKKKSDVKVTGNKKIKLLPWEKTFLELIEDDNPVYHKIPGKMSVGTSGGPPIKEAVIEDIFLEESVLGTAEKPDENQEPRSQLTKKVKTATGADCLKKKIRNSGKTVSSYEADETKDLSTPQLQRIVLLQQFKLNKIKIERQSLLLENMKKVTVEKSSQTDVNIDEYYTLMMLE